MHPIIPQPKLHIFTEFMRLHMVNTRQTAADIEDKIKLDRHFIDQLVSGEIVPAKTHETVRRFAKLFGVPEDMAAALIDGDEKAVTRHLDLCAEMIVLKMLG